MATIHSPAPMIVLAGNIGTGKTTVGRAVAESLNLPLREESVFDNPYLSRYYSDPVGWVFHLNMYFLGVRSAAIKDAAGAGSVFDRSLYEDRIFVDAALEGGITTEDNYLIFRSLFDTLESVLPRPTILVYLEAPVAILHERVRDRNREFERSITQEFLSGIQTRYDCWIDSYSHSPLIKVDTSKIDFRSDSEAAGKLCYKISQVIAEQS